MTDNNNSFELSTSSLLTTLWGYRKILIIVGAVAILASTIAAFTIKPKFKSTAIIFPPVANQASKDLFSQMKQEGLTVFGETEEAEQFLQIITSRSLKDSVIAKLNLMAYYGITPEESSAKNKTYSRYDQSVRVMPTQYQSIIIEVLDYNPEMAAKIANTVVDMSDTKMRSVKAQIAVKAKESLEKQLGNGLKEMQALEDSLRMVMLNGVVDLKEQAEQYYKDYTKALLANDKRSIAILEKQIKPLQLYGSKYKRYCDEIKQMAEQLTKLRRSLKIIEVEAEQNIPSQFVIDRAVAADKKAYPKRLIIILLSLLSSEFFAVFAIIVTESLRRIIKN